MNFWTSLVILPWIAGYTNPFIGATIFYLCVVSLIGNLFLLRKQKRDRSI